MLTNSPIMRVFFGIPIPEDQAQMLRKRLLKANPQLKNQVRWTRAGNHHITIRFLGNIAEQKIPRLIQSINEAIKTIGPFQIVLWNITLFPPNHPKMATANIQPSSQLQSLHNIIDVIVSTDFPSEHRPYLPHITLFRIKNKNNIEFEKVSLSNEKIQVTSFILYQSIPIENGSLYVPLHKFFL